ncbi:LysR family transcriptional regulator [Kibdelosporangium philippinense]|uniref:LysR family transcriptional regulator n=1 Tax=Kibdelosporangium philippinense TaxID=211113 RepID=A0ABS8Z5T1_9PSEU|nr:LysR family transcriptional regulator [Kibdelosporangium philippinense]MCE7002852.1 LysR family transcriptional regulator [Kibdelosporangium philippinense]
MDRVETRELSYFVTLAEELHFGRAADRLGMAQPPLSRAISRLERRIGVQLFDRSTRAVTLTPAGQVFLTESRKALAAVDTAVRRAQRAGHVDRLILATRPGTASGLLPAMIREYRKQPGAAEVKVVFTTDQIGALRTGAADIGLACGTTDTEGFETILLAEEKSVALLPPHHRLAGQAAVTLEDLARDPEFVHQPPLETLDHIVESVALGRITVVVGEGVTNRLGHTAVAVPVIDSPPISVLLAWPRGIPFEARNAFVKTAQKLVTAPRNGLGHAAVNG